MLKPFIDMVLAYLLKLVTLIYLSKGRVIIYSPFSSFVVILSESTLFCNLYDCNIFIIFSLLFFFTSLKPSIINMLSSSTDTLIFFDVLPKDTTSNNNVKLVFKWKPWDELE